MTNHPNPNDPWQPLRIVSSTTRLSEGETVHIDAYENDLYKATLYERRNNWGYLHIVRHDQAAVRDWRHLQAIKNETAGPEREALELFPAESRLVDEANVSHLFVARAGERLPVGASARSVKEPGSTTFGQRSWQDGISTGPTSKP